MSGGIFRERSRENPKGFLCLLSIALAASFCGCKTHGTFKPIDLSTPGWTVREGQAVWHMPGKRPELAGDIILAMNSDGRSFIEFSKMPFPLVRASCTDSRWEIEFPPQKLCFSGGGSPPRRLAWLHVCNGLAGRDVRAPWRFEHRADGSWRLDTPSSRESVEGYFLP